MTVERLFTAIELPQRVVDALVEHQPPAGPGVRPVVRARMHLTLHFIGDAEPEDVEAVLSRVRAQRFGLTISTLGMFARRGQPAALWAGVDRDERLEALYDAIGAALAGAGFGLDSRPYRPHITLARLKPHASRDTIKAFLSNTAIDPLEFPVARFVLFASEPTDTGSRYTPRAHFELD